jgi:hypothetical protein
MASGVPVDLVEVEEHFEQLEAGAVQHVAAKHGNEARR